MNVTAENDIMMLLQPAGRDPMEVPFCRRHIQVLLEDRHSEWIVKDALRRLARKGRVATFGRGSVPELNGLKKIKEIKFYADPRAVKDEAGRQRVVGRVIEEARLFAEYCDTRNSTPRGDHLERLVRDLLEASGFRIEGTHTREYDGRSWTESKDNLDIIARRPGSGLAIGVEVKNELGMMEKKEITKKVKICRRLGVVPVFATRWNAPHADYIRECGGFGWTFGVQIVPSGQRDLVARLLRAVPGGGAGGGGAQRRGLPIAVGDDLPEGSVRALGWWVRRMEGMPPTGAWAA